MMGLDESLECRNAPTAQTGGEPTSEPTLGGKRNMKMGLVIIGKLVCQLFIWTNFLIWSCNFFIWSITFH